MSRNKPTTEQFDKLPKFAQAYIRDIEREREEAISNLNSWIDTQTPKPFFVEEMLSLGEGVGSPSFKKRYVEGRWMIVRHAGVEMKITLRDRQIDLSWGSDRRDMGVAAFIPTSFQQARIMTLEEAAK